MKGDVKKASMLFDHRIDKEENKNRVNEKKYKSKVESLSSFIKVKKSSLKKYMRTPIMSCCRLMAVALFLFAVCRYLLSGRIFY